MAKIPVAGVKPEPDVLRTPDSVIIGCGGGNSDWRERVREIVFPVWAEDYGLYVFDADGKMILQIRGWGGLTSSGLSGQEAAEVQEKHACFIADAMNEYAKTMGLYRTGPNE